MMQDDGLCFVCGDKNPAGLHITFSFDGNDAIAETSIAPAFQGWKGIIHGGIVTTLLDEVMAKACIFSGHNAVTRDIAVKFRKPVSSNVQLTLRGRVKDTRGPLIITSAELEQDGIVKASAEATFAVMNHA